VGVFEGFGDEVRPDNLQPKRVPEDVRAAVGDRLVDDVPGLNPALVASDDGVDVIAHPLEQLLAGRAWPIITKSAAETATKTRPAAAGSIRSRRIRGSEECRCGRVRHPGRRIGSLENPGGRLAVPNEGVAHNIHVVADAEVHISVGWTEIIALRAFARMNEGPLQVVLRGDLVELLFDERDVSFDFFRGSIDVVGWGRGARRDSAVDSRADIEMILIGVLEAGRVCGPDRGTNGEQRRREQADAGGEIRVMGLHSRKVRVI